jgi:hypothetical protein
MRLGGFGQQHDVRPAARRAECDGQTDAAACAGHHHGAIRESLLLVGQFVS